VPNLVNRLLEISQNRSHYACRHQAPNSLVGVVAGNMPQDQFGEITTPAEKGKDKEGDKGFPALG